MADYDGTYFGFFTYAPLPSEGGGALKLGVAELAGRIPATMEVNAGSAPDAEPGGYVDFFADGSKSGLVLFTVEEYAVYVEFDSGEQFKVSPDVGVGGFFRRYSTTSFKVWNVSGGETGEYQIVAMK